MESGFTACERETCTSACAGAALSDGDKAFPAETALPAEEALSGSFCRYRLLHQPVCPSSVFT